MSSFYYSSLFYFIYFYYSVFSKKMWTYHKVAPVLGYFPALCSCFQAAPRSSHGTPLRWARRRFSLLASLTHSSPVVPSAFRKLKKFLGPSQSTLDSPELLLILPAPATSPFLGPAAAASPAPQYHPGTFAWYLFLFSPLIFDSFSCPSLIWKCLKIKLLHQSQPSSKYPLCSNGPPWQCRKLASIFWGIFEVLADNSPNW